MLDFNLITTGTGTKEGREKAEWGATGTLGVRGPLPGYRLTPLLAIGGLGLGCDSYS